MDTFFHVVIGAAAVVAWLLISVALIAAAVALYVLPWIMARKRCMTTSGFLLFVNIVLGWTLLGWLVCLLWAATGETGAQRDFYRGRAA